MSDERRLAPDGRPYLVLVRGGIAPEDTPEDERGESLAARLALDAADARQEAEQLKVRALPEDANEVQELTVYAERIEASLDRPQNFASPTETIAQEPPWGPRAATEPEDKELVGAIRNSSLTKCTARARTLRYAQRAGVLEDALALADEIKAHGGIERALAHQMAAAHRAAMNLAGLSADARDFDDAAKAAAASARMMVAFQTGALTFNEMRKGKRSRMKYVVEKRIYTMTGSASGTRAAETETRPVGNQRLRKTP